MEIAESHAEQDLCNTERRMARDLPIYADRVLVFTSAGWGIDGDHVRSGRRVRFNYVLELILSALTPEALERGG